MLANWLTRKNTSGKGRVFVGLSGGVDSAVSAALLQKAGYDVVGAFIRIALPGYPCSAQEDRLDARRVAAHLRIPFVEIDLSGAYEKKVFEISMAEFERGRTPNPDALCNREIKFGLFYDWCIEQGADFVATGHYAQTKQKQVETSIAQRDGASIANSQQGIMRARQDLVSVELHMGADTNKDQSYFLWAVPEAKLRNTLFPVGHLPKPAVRKLAAQFKLPNSGRPDSQGLCFLGDISIEDMLEQELTLLLGDVLNEAGEVVGVHDGAQAYTLGQRHGFTLTAKTPDTPAQYVIAKDVEFNTIMVSPNKFPTNAAATTLELSETNWIGEFADGEVEARYRYRQQLIPATLHRADGGRATVVLHAPHYVPEGQSLVLYRGERCLGGGIIQKATLTQSWRSSSTNQTEPASPLTSASL